MSDKQTFVLVHDEARRRAIAAVTNAPDGYAVVVQPKKRSLEQNAAQWPILEQFSAQMLWPVNGAMTQLSSAEYKDVLTAAFRQEVPRIAAGLNGGMVMLGMRTRDMGKREFGEWLEFLHYIAAERGIDLQGK